MGTLFELREIDFASIMRRDILLGIMTIFVMVTLPLAFLLAALSFLSLGTLGMVLVAGFAGSLLVFLDYRGQSRRSTRSAALNADSIRFENQSGHGALFFEDLSRIVVTAAKNGGVQLEDVSGGVAYLFPGLGRGSEFASRLQNAVTEWAIQKGRLMKMSEPKIGSFSKRKSIEIILGVYPTVAEAARREASRKSAPGFLLAGVIFLVSLYVAVLGALESNLSVGVPFGIVAFTVLALVLFKARKIGDI